MAMDPNIKVLFSLLRFELDGTIRDEDTDAAAEVNPEKLYRLSMTFDLGHLATDALYKLGLLPTWGELSKAFLEAQYDAVMRYECINAELTSIKNVFNEEKIPYLPLKGAVIRALYPEPWMRTSCDIDILIHPEDIDRAVDALSQKLGYTAGDRDRHDISLFSPGGTHLELHFNTVEEGRAACASEVMAGVWEKAVLSEGSCYCMRDDMFYFYHIAHMAKHFEVGGCGIRPFLDLWLLDREKDKKEARDRLLREGGLLTFAEAMSKVSRVWFDGEESDELTDAVASLNISGGMYGSLGNRVALRRGEGEGKFRYFFRRLFPPVSVLIPYEPRVTEQKWRIPIAWCIRLFRVVRDGRTKSVASEIQANFEGGDVSTGGLLRRLGLEEPKADIGVE